MPTSKNTPLGLPERISASALRRFLRTVLPSGGDLHAFCLDCFPDVALRAGIAQDRLFVENLLLQLYPADEILSRLLSHSSYATAARQQLGLLRDTALDRNQDGQPENASPAQRARHTPRRPAIFLSLAGLAALGLASGIVVQHRRPRTSTTICPAGRHIPSPETQLGVCEPTQAACLFDSHPGLKLLVTRFAGTDAPARKLGARVGRGLQEALLRAASATLKPEAPVLARELQIQYVPCTLPDRAAAGRIAKSWGADAVLFGDAELTSSGPAEGFSAWLALNNRGEQSALATRRITMADLARFAATDPRTNDTGLSPGRQELSGMLSLLIGLHARKREFFEMAAKYQTAAGPFLKHAAGETGELHRLHGATLTLAGQLPTGVVELKTAQRHCRERDADCQVPILLGLATASRMELDGESEKRYLELAQGYLPQVTDLSIQASFLIVNQTWMLGRGRVKDSCDQAATAVAMAEQGRDDEILASALAFEVTCEELSGNQGLARLKLDRLLSFSRQHGKASFEAAALAKLFAWEASYGNIDRARQLWRESETVCKLLGPTYEAALKAEATVSGTYDLVFSAPLTHEALSSEFRQVESNIRANAAVRSSFDMALAVSLRWRKPDTAIDFLKHSLALSRKSESLLFRSHNIELLIWNQIMQGDTKAALAESQEYIDQVAGFQIGISHARAWAVHAAVLRQAGRRKEAIAAYQTALAAFPAGVLPAHEMYTRGALAELLAGAERYAEAVALLRRRRPNLASRGILLFREPDSVRSRRLRDPRLALVNGSNSQEPALSQSLLIGPQTAVPLPGISGARLLGFAASPRGRSEDGDQGGSSTEADRSSALIQAQLERVGGLLQTHRWSEAQPHLEEATRQFLAQNAPQQFVEQRLLIALWTGLGKDGQALGRPSWTGQAITRLRQLGAAEEAADLKVRFANKRHCPAQNDCTQDKPAEPMPRRKNRRHGA